MTKWGDEAHAMRNRGALVNGAALLEEVLRDFEAATSDFQAETLSLSNAARESGYSVDYLGRLVREGQIPNAGRPNAPKVRRSDLPRKASSLQRRDPCIHLDATTPGQIARSVVTSDEGDAR
ncbi:MAG: hypothetical protein JSW71_22715 [Gemmatimonadota bacterium]|nr:MAG: hypothetical protein JSW71_22715 [Gemmatimonadota bacterium]